MPHFSPEALLAASRAIGACANQSEISAILPSLLAPLVAVDYVGISGQAVTSDGASTLDGMATVFRAGPLAVGRRAPTKFSEEECHILSLLGDLLESRKKLDRAEMVLAINNDIASNLELQSLLRSTAQSLRQALGCDFVTITIPDEAAGQMITLAMDFPDGRGAFREGNRIPIEGSVLGRVYQTRKRLLLSSLPDPHDAVYERAKAEGIVAACFSPLIHRDRAVGVLSAGRRTAGPLSEENAQLLDAVARQVAIALDNSMAYQKISELKEQLAQEKLYLEDEIRGELNFSEIVGSSPALRKVLKQVETVAPTDSNVLISGETGSGKELIARAIHELSSRRRNTFVKLNCAAIPTGLLESELFGHERGAFTGAVAQRIGRFELASQGTIFLDEVGEIPLELQPKLLRVLQEREFERLGSSRTLRSEARLIAATNRDLGEMVEKQAFRADLYYRLNVFPVHVPPLRERPEDIPVLVRHFVHQFARKMKRQIETIPSETMIALTRYPWPGNIRELQNLIERAMILSAGPVLRVPLEELKSRGASAAMPEAAGKQTLADAERTHILAILRETNWVLAGADGAAARLGMNRSTLRFRMSKLGIERPTGK